MVQAVLAMLLLDLTQTASMWRLVLSSFNSAVSKTGDTVGGRDETKKMENFEWGGRGWGVGGPLFYAVAD